MKWGIAGESLREDPEPTEGKYVCLDVVRFTERTVQNQVRIVRHLNQVVVNSLKSIGAEPGPDLIKIPIGDGIVIGLLNFDSFDIHVRLALEVLKGVAKWNEGAQGEAKFKMRIGVNEGHDHVILDINGKRNVIGRGISQTQRLMIEADPNQILLGVTVFERLRDDEVYRGFLQEFRTVDKHGNMFSAILFKGHRHMSSPQRIG